MKKKRLIPILLLKNGHLVQSKNFESFRKLGNPKTSIQRFSEWSSDELIFLDISRDSSYDLNRDDLNFSNNKTMIDIISDISKVVFMPITIGGKIKSIKNIEQFLLAGADKISINTQAQISPKLIRDASKEFGSQCIVNSIDVKKVNNQYEIFHSCGKKKSEYRLIDWLHIIEDNGVGEVLVNSIDNDGAGNGFDIKLAEIVKKNINIPIIFCGGAGDYNDFYELVKKTDIDAVAAANFFQFQEQSTYLTKKFLYERKLNFRKPGILNLKF
tara:strand:- start:7296 stop:8108 length:813 start_codon:yes stop_codon:yes gene_type:complete